MAPFTLKPAFASVAHWVTRQAMLIAISVTMLFLSTSSLPVQAKPTSQPATLSLGYTGGIHIVDPDGRNRVPFWVGRGEITVDFTLYALSTPEMAQRYAAIDTSQLAIETDGLTPVLTWQQSYSVDDFNAGKTNYVTLPGGPRCPVFM